MKNKYFLGSDISQKMIDECKKNYNKYPNSNFLVLDIGNTKLNKKFDYVVTTGIFKCKK